jgi:hypothetical protein
MFKKLLLSLLLATAVAGCRTWGNRPDPAPCPAPGPVPQAPRTQPLPPGGTLPPGANHIIVGMCPDTGAYLGAGVDTKTRSFTYVVRGDRNTRETFLANAYRAGVPVVLYTSPVKVARPSGTGGGDGVFDPCTDIRPMDATRPRTAPTTGPAPTGPTGTAPTGTTGVARTSLVADPVPQSPGEAEQMIGDEPPPDPEDPGATPPEFSELSWQTATAVDNTADAVQPQ